MAAPVLEIAPLGFQWQTLDPFLFCVHHNDAYPAGDEHMAPRASLDGRQIGNDFSGKDGWSMYHGDQVPGFPQHPHRGFETITVARQGFIDHSDSLGAAARFGRGDVQWMTAGKGVVHSEMFPLLNENEDNPAELFQIWLNLPAKNKMAAPYFSMYWNEDLPRLRHTDEQGRATDLVLIAGEHPGARGVTPPPDSWAAQDSQLKILTIKMQAGAVWTLPPAQAGVNRVLYFFHGDALRVGDREIPARHAILLAPDQAATLQAGNADETELLLLQARPIGEPVAQYGPFVMNHQHEIQAAFRDYQLTAFGGWPWPADAPVHERSQGRFARHADGRIEVPGTVTAER